MKILKIIILALFISSVLHAQSYQNMMTIGRALWGPGRAIEIDENNKQFIGAGYTLINLQNHKYIDLESRIFDIKSKSVSSRMYYFVATENYLYVLSFITHSNSDLLILAKIPAELNQIDIINNFLYGAGKHFYIIDISTPENPLIISQVNNVISDSKYSNGRRVQDIAFQQSGVVFVSMAWEGMKVFNVLDVYSPFQSEFFGAWWGSLSANNDIVVASFGNYDTNVRVLKIFNPDSIVIADTLDFSAISIINSKIYPTKYYCIQAFDSLVFSTFDYFYGHSSYPYNSVDLNVPRSSIEWSTSIPKVTEDMGGSVGALLRWPGYFFPIHSFYGIEFKKMTSQAYHISKHLNFFVTSDFNNGIKIMDMSNPANPILLSEKEFPMNVSSISIKDSILYCLSDNVYIIDLSQNDFPIVNQINGSYTISIIKNNVLYLVSSTDKILKCYDISNPNSVQFLSQININNSNGISNVSVNDNYLFLLEYQDKTHIVDITDSYSINLIYTYNFGGKDIVVNNNKMFLAGNTFNIYNIENILSPYLEGGLPIPSSKLCLGNNSIYLCGDDHNVYSINVANSLNPEINGYFNTHSYLLDIKTDSNDVLYVTNWDKGLTILKNELTAQLEFSSDTLNFGIVQNKSHQKNPLTIINSGSRLLLISSIRTTNSNFYANDTSYYLNPQDSIEIQVEYNPMAAKKDIGSLVIESNIEEKYTIIKLFGESKQHQANITIHQNPAFSQQSNLNFISNLPIKEKPTMLVNFRSNKDTLVLDSITTQIHSTPYNFSSQGSGNITISCTSTFDRDTTFSRNFNVSIYKSGITNQIVSPSNEFKFQFEKNACSNNTFFTVIENPYLENSKSTIGIKSNVIDLQPAINLNGVNYIIINYDILKISNSESIDKLAIYMKVNGNWKILKTYVDKLNKIMKAKINQTGEFAIGEGKNYELTNEIPTTFRLYQNYPNPFNNTTTIKFDIPKQCKIKISIYDIMGKKIKQLVNNSFQSGTYEYLWNGTNQYNIQVSSGIYFYRISGDNWNYSKKLILLK